MKKNMREFVENSTRAHIGGYNMSSMTKEEAREFILQNTNMTTHDSAVTSIQFTRDPDNVCLFLLNLFDYGINPVSETVPQRINSSATCK